MGNKASTGSASQEMQPYRRDSQPGGSDSWCGQCGDGEEQRLGGLTGEAPNCTGEGRFPETSDF